MRYVVDMAEIPTLQKVPLTIKGLELRVNGRTVPLRVTRTALAHPLGAAGLHTTRFQAILAGPEITAAARVSYRDDSYPGRIGWKEVVVGAHTASTSDELRAYPKDLLSSPLDIHSAVATLSPTNDPPPTVLSGKALRAPDRVADSGFAKLIIRGNLSFLVILASLAVALFWGAAHALSPGHGKTIVTAYLVGSRGTPRHAALLGLITTVTHTIGVFALGAVTLALSAFIVPDRLYPWINVLSGALVVIVGLAVLTGRWRSAHAHAHEHSHAPPEHDHRASVFRRRGTRTTITAVTIITTSRRRTCGASSPSESRAASCRAPPRSSSCSRPSRCIASRSGCCLIVAFSFGLALTITGIGLLALFAKRAFGRFDLNGGLIRFLPAVSALVIVVAGLAMTVRAIPELHV